MRHPRKFPALPEPRTEQDQREIKSQGPKGCRCLYILETSPILNIGLGGGGGVRASANIFKAIFGTSMVYMLRGSKNGLVDVRGPPSHCNRKSLGYMLRGLNGLAGGGR